MKFIFILAAALASASLRAETTTTDTEYTCAPSKPAYCNPESREFHLFTSETLRQQAIKLIKENPPSLVLTEHYANDISINGSKILSVTPSSNSVRARVEVTYTTNDARTERYLASGSNLLHGKLDGLPTANPGRGALLSNIKTMINCLAENTSIRDLHRKPTLHINGGSCDKGVEASLKSMKSNRLTSGSGGGSVAIPGKYNFKKIEVTNSFRYSTIMNGEAFAELSAKYGYFEKYGALSADKIFKPEIHADSVILDRFVNRLTAVVYFATKTKHVQVPLMARGAYITSSYENPIELGGEEIIEKGIIACYQKYDSYSYLDLGAASYTPKACTFSLDTERSQAPARHSIDLSKFDFIPIWDVACISVEGDTATECGEGRHYDYNFPLRTMHSDNQVLDALLYESDDYASDEFMDFNPTNSGIPLKLFEALGGDSCKAVSSKLSSMDWIQTYKVDSTGSILGGAGTPILKMHNHLLETSTDLCEKVSLAEAYSSRPVYKENAALESHTVTHRLSHSGGPAKVVYRFIGKDAALEGLPAQDKQKANAPIETF